MRYDSAMQFVHESSFEVPVVRLFAFHERPEALRLLIPPWERVQIVQPPASLAPGTRVVLRTHLAPLVWLTWVAEHTRYEKDVLFEDRMVSGPFRSWLHTHRFLPAGGGRSVLRDEVELTLPLGLPGALVRPRLERMFEYRHAATRAALS
jgi:ligand-binding SRPBCC domain-containing protein